VAYVRFASVYGNFQGIKDFAETLSELQPSQWTDETRLELELEEIVNRSSPINEPIIS
jgi:hypothetical protein